MILHYSNFRTRLTTKYPALLNLITGTSSSSLLTTPDVSADSLQSYHHRLQQTGHSAEAILFAPSGWSTTNVSLIYLPGPDKSMGWGTFDLSIAPSKPKDLLSIAGVIHILNPWSRITRPQSPGVMNGNWLNFKKWNLKRTIGATFSSPELAPFSIFWSPLPSL